MSFVFRLIKHPIIRIISLILILYFGLYKNKESSDSLGRRLSKENIERNLKEVKVKSQFIVLNLSAAKEAQKNGVVPRQELSPEEIQAIDFLETEEEVEGEGENVVKCGDEVSFSYEIYDAKFNSKIDSFDNEKLIIGDNKNILVERKIIGMKKGATRDVKIPRDMKTDMQNLKLLLKFNETDLIYRIKLIDFVAISEEKKCN